jgi:uncharacterized protein (TIGR01777 family)
MMNILITGGTGFIGKPLCTSLVKHGHSLTVLSRRPELVPKLCGATVNAVDSLDALTAEMHFDAIINVAGEGIVDKRWSKQRKQQLLDSRIQTTNQLIAFISRARQKPSVLVSGSAIGFYGDQGDELLTENSQITTSDDFAHQLCVEWEQAARKASNEGVRVCLLRTGLVVGKGGGFLQRMLAPFKLRLGGRIGDGQQWMSWIHRNDLISMIDMLLNASDLNGIFNATTPNPVTNHEFTQTLAKVLRRPAVFPVPAIVLKLAMGEMASLLLGGQRVIPQRFLDHGYQFQFEHLESALSEVV